MTRRLMLVHLGTRLLNALMFLEYMRGYPIPADRMVLMACTGASFLGGLGMSMYAALGGDLKRAAYVLLWLDLPTIGGAIYVTGMVASPFLVVLPPVICTAYFIDFDLAVARRFGVTCMALLAGLFAAWWTHGQPGANWSPAAFPRWTFIVFAIQMMVCFVTIVYAGSLPGRLVRELERQEAVLLEQQHRAELGAALSMITHEIRTPLTTIGGNLELATDLARRDGQDAVVKRLTIAAEEAVRLAGMLESVLSFAREKRGRYTFGLHDCRAILDRAVEFMRLKHGHAGIRLEVVLAGEGAGTVWCDRDAMHQVLVNLLDNAVQQRPRGRPLRVTLELGREAGGCRLRLTDNGTGIPPELRAHLFGRFASGREGGTGLGLAIVRQTMLDHGGSVELERSDGTGTTFVLRLPDAGPAEAVTPPG